MERLTFRSSGTGWSRRHLLTLGAAALAARGLHGIEPSRIKLAVTTDEIDEDLKTALEFLRRYGLRHAEIRNLWGKYNTEQPLEKIREAAGLLEEYRVKLAILDTGFFKVPLPAENAAGQRALDEQWRLLERAMERAKILGTGLIRTFGFTYGKEGGVAPKHYPRIYELVAESARRARAKGFTLAVENVGGSYISTGRESAALLEAVKDDGLTLTWDPNNAAASGEKDPFPEGYRLLDPARIRHVHLRDYRYVNGQAEWCLVGDGVFDHVGQIRALRREGYEGAYSLETHYKVEGSKMKATERSLEALLARVAQV